MSNQILPNAVSLITMTDTEIREELCKDIYNRANSHEMIRRLSKLAMQYSKMLEYEKSINFDYENLINQIKSTIRNYEK